MRRVREPDYALGYVGEGEPILGKQYKTEKFPLTDALKAKGVTEVNWAAVCEGLRKGKGFGVPPPSALPGIGGGFESAIGHANDDLFDGLGPVGVYAEYGPGQKAMVVLDKTQTDKFVLPSLRIF